MTIDAQNLVKNLKSGNKEAYVFLYKHYYKGLCASAYRFIRNIYHAEEIVQNVIFKLWEKRQSLNIPDNIENYLYKAVYNESINFCKRIQNEHKFKQNIDPELIMRHTDFQDPISEKELIAKINGALGHLPQRSREIFEMNRNQGLSYKEIADQLEISVKGVEFHMIRALKILKDQLKEYIYLFVFIFLITSRF